MDVDSFLREWAVSLVKYKDTVKKSIQAINQRKEGFTVTFHDGDAFYLVRGVLDSLDGLRDLLRDPEQRVNLIFINSKENLKFVLKNWKWLCGFTYLTLYFVNPFSETERYWILRPYIHSRICDESSLQAGLKAMFESVEEIDEARLTKLIKTQKI